MKHLSKAALGASLIAGQLLATAAAADFDVTVTNLTRGIHFTPLLVTAHDSGTRLFTSGSAASNALQEMAEGGSIASLVAALPATAVSQQNPAGGLLGPGTSTPTVTLNTDAQPTSTQLSVVAMMLPTNDGFIGLNGITIPTTPGTYSYNVNAYDAGTEANDEIRGGGAVGTPGFPVPPPIDTAPYAPGNGGTGVTGVSAEGFVHIHRGVLGDSNNAGGASDINSSVHRWLNPVARVTITVR